jgi:hypothetical protein
MESVYRPHPDSSPVVGGEIIFRGFVSPRVPTGLTKPSVR